jgi:hypothetical protein
MKILSDEDIIWDELIDQLNNLGTEYGCSFDPFPRPYRDRGTPDEEVPGICRREGAAALLTTNYKEFARHLIYYQALLSAGVSAIVLRQPNPHTDIPDVDYQVALLEPHLRNIVMRLERTEEPLLFVVNKSGVRTNRLQDLIDRFST